MLFPDPIDRTEPRPNLWHWPEPAALSQYKFMFKAIAFIVVVYLALQLFTGYSPIGVTFHGVPWHGPGGDLLGAGVAMLAGLLACIIGIACVFAVIAGLVVLAAGLPIFLICLLLCALLAPVLLPLVLLLGLGMFLLMGVGALFA